MAWLKRLFGILTLKTYLDRRRATRRRANYDFLKAEITKRHLNGFNGITVDFQDRKFDAVDMHCFRPPMYQIAKNQDQKYCIFWHAKKMSEEIGPMPIGGSVESSNNSPLIQDTQGSVLPASEGSGI